ncbi:hypothetical protein ACLOJK_012585 [Asimina triloba]
MRADLMAAGDQSGWKDFTYAAAPVAWGHAMDVPDKMLYVEDLLSSGTPESEVTGGKAAKMSTPGALISGYRSCIKQMISWEIFGSKEGFCLGWGCDDMKYPP